MRQPDGSLPEVYLQPGESHLVKEPTILRTVLGSCLASHSVFRGLALARFAIPCCRAPPLTHVPLTVRSYSYIDFTFAA